MEGKRAIGRMAKWKPRKEDRGEGEKREIGGKWREEGDGGGGS